MKLLQSIPFRINSVANTLSERYPDINGRDFSFNLLLDTDYIFCVVMICYATNNLALNVYNSNNVALQPRIWIGSDIDLIFIHGYRFIYNEILGRFELYKR